jgi:hypothetical protein
MGQLVLLFCHPLPLPPIMARFVSPVLTTAVNCVAVVVYEMLSVDLTCHCTVLKIEQQHFVVGRIARSTYTVTRLIGRYYCSQCFVPTSHMCSTTRALRPPTRSETETKTIWSIAVMLWSFLPCLR